MPEYKLGNVSFSSEEELEAAKKELNTIQLLKSKYDVKDPKIAKAIHDKFMPKTKIGLVFQKQLQASFNVDEDLISSIDRELSAKKVDKKPVVKSNNILNSMSCRIFPSGLLYLTSGIFIFVTSIVNLILGLNNKDITAEISVSSFITSMFLIILCAVPGIFRVIYSKKLKQGSTVLSRYFVNNHFEFIIAFVISIIWFFLTMIVSEMSPWFVYASLIFLAIGFCLESFLYILYVKRNRQLVQTTGHRVSGSAKYIVNIVGRLVTATFLIISITYLTYSALVYVKVEGCEVVIESSEPMSKSEKDGLISYSQDVASRYSTESYVYASGLDRIIIDIPGVSGYDYVKADILEYLSGETNLYFISETDEEGNVNYAYTGGGATGYTLTKTIDELIADGSIKLQGTDIADAKAISYQDSFENTSYGVSLIMTEEGTSKLAEATTRAYSMGETLAIYFNGDIISAPRVNGALTTGEAELNGNFTYEEADKLAFKLKHARIVNNMDLKITYCGKKIFKYPINIFDLLFHKSSKLRDYWAD